MMDFSKRDFRLEYIRRCCLGAALLIFLVPGLSKAGDIGNGLRKSKFGKTYPEFGIEVDTVKKARPASKTPQKTPDKKTLEELLKQARSNIKQVPRSVPKLKPQPVKEEVKIRSSSPNNRGSKRKPF